MLERAPLDKPLVAVRGTLDLLPLDALHWTDFEGLLWRVLRDVEGLRNPQIYGLPGQKQLGLDMVAEESDGSGVALQSKDVRQFGAARITAAVDAFRSTTRPFPVSKFIIGVSCEVKSRPAVDRFKELRAELRPVELVMWDKRELSVMLKGAPHIVIEYFGSHVAEAFCRPFVVGNPIVPRHDVVAIREAIARTPEVTTGAGAKIEEAKRIADANPVDALAMVESAQLALEEAGFAGHAAQHDALRASLLVEVGRGVDATRRRLDQFWVALGRGQSIHASIAGNDIRTLAGQVEEKAAGDHANAAETALELYENPVAYVPPFEQLMIGETADRARLAALAGEIALADGNLAWLAGNSAKLRRLGLKIDREPDADILRVRLRLLAAEGSGRWSEILKDARTLMLGHELIGLVNARHARYLAGQQNFEGADLAWDEASGAACLANHWTDAARWTFSRRAFRTRWRLFATEELLPIQTALLSKGPDATILPRDEDALEQALSQLSTRKLRSAAIAGQRALRDAVTLSDWAGEGQARRVLAEVLQASGEPRQAAHHLVRAGDVDGLKRLAGNVGDLYLDVTEYLDAKPYWIVGAAYRFVTNQADLVPDADVSAVADAVVRDLGAARAGTLVDMTVTTGSRFLGAIAAVAGLSERLNEVQAENVLAFFESQPAVEENRYRHHDDDEARAVAGILLTHQALEDRALAHLVTLLARSSTSRKTYAHDAVTSRMTMARPLLAALAEGGNSWAREVLFTDSPNEVTAEEAQEARARLEAPLKIIAGVTTIGAGSSAVSDSVLARTLPPSRQQASLRRLLINASNLHVDAADRAAYLLAASNLASPPTRVDRKELFEQALALAISPPLYVTDASDARFAHPLGGFRITGKTDSRAEAAYVAAGLAQTEREKEGARSASLALIGDDRVAEVWAARAIQRLGDTMTPDIGFLSGQGWAFKSLAAILWARTVEPVAVGDRLASDPDPRVRRAFAAELVACQTRDDAARRGDRATSRANAVRRDTRAILLAKLQADPRFSVRVAAGS
ncbi:MULTISPECIES: hypothetical protein [unclassified Nocardioides]|uniref:hypothetical protein n=1 Tax=unclassified Nocardioides TaxID=2615069 RepID=UPI0006FAF3C7|nr:MULTISPECIES: hypothetical protein [unclassified Nocardioides]KRA30030.1 hypothetical protein ASD81_20285 [Nocardioides sp. Root614]KRA86950.1 hypothetical protein ASD84_22500 [Nocardioides sp. Root682]